MKNVKNFQIASNALAGISAAEKAAIYAELYGENEFVTYVQAVHDDDDCEYSWYIPAGSGIVVQPGDRLLVEQSFGIGRAVVTAVSGHLTMSIDEHVENVHPYCAVLDVVDEHYSLDEVVEVDYEEYDDNYEDEAPAIAKRGLPLGIGHELLETTDVFSTIACLNRRVDGKITAFGRELPQHQVEVFELVSGQFATEVIYGLWIDLRGDKFDVLDWLRKPEDIQRMAIRSHIVRVSLDVAKILRRLRLELEGNMSVDPSIATVKSMLGHYDGFPGSVWQFFNTAEDCIKTGANWSSYQVELDHVYQRAARYNGNAKKGLAYAWLELAMLVGREYATPLDVANQCQNILDLRVKEIQKKK